MKNVAFLVAISAALAFTTSAAREPSERQVLDGIRRSVVFEVVPNRSGRAESCQAIEVRQLPSGQIDSEFIPSAKFVSNACDDTLGKRSNWVPNADATGEIIPKLESCLWSEVVPDSPICRAELALVFADQIPKGVGKTVVFQLTADSQGELVSCAFGASYSLAGTETLDFVPHQLYVEDGCRKFRSVRWKNSDRKPEQSFYMPCRFIDEVPTRAFCETRFGE
jgi:hypothetical protein